MTESLHSRLLDLFVLNIAPKITFQERDQQIHCPWISKFSKRFDGI